MNPVLVGSRALNFWYPERSIKPSTDWDVISYDEHLGCEVHDPVFLNNQDMTGYATDQKVVLPDGTTAFVMSKLGLAIMKRSHLWRDLSFQKHITDYHKFGLCDEINEAKKYGIVQSDLQNRIELTKKAFPQGSPNLMQSKEDFFNDAVKKKHDHDWLHELYAHYDAPLYTKMQTDSSLAWCDKKLWDTFTHEEKVKCCAEEAYVIATERFLVPSDWQMYPKLAYLIAVDKICTTLCSGWFRDFAIDNYPAIQNIYDKNKILGVKFKIESTPENERKYNEA